MVPLAKVPSVPEMYLHAHEQWVVGKLGAHHALLSRIIFDSANLHALQETHFTEDESIRGRILTTGRVQVLPSSNTSCSC
jgi:hypothetical protein